MFDPSYNTPKQDKAHTHTHTQRESNNKNNGNSREQGVVSSPSFPHHLYPPEINDNKKKDSHKTKGSH